PVASLRLASSWRHQGRKFQGYWRKVETGGDRSRPAKINVA
ncbi:hypothetical protein A2U01_0082810, partial [Trifolium medium]|nr:hypothetical protein [Trifolium medium]